MSTGISRRWSTRVLAVALLAGILAGCLDRAVTGPENTSGVSFAARLVVLDGNSQTGAVNQALTSPIKLRVTDVNGSPVEGATVSFSLRQGGGSVNPPTARSAADGTVNATWTLGTVLGSQKIVAILTGQWVVDSVTLTATATNGAAAKLAVDAGDKQRAMIGTALPTAVSVLVTDAFGNPVPGAEVTFRVSSGGGRVELLRSTSDATGRISATWTLGTTAGAQALTASLANGATTSFSAVADAGTAAQIILESGSGQTGTVGRTLASPVSVRVVDAYGNGVKGLSVSWAADDGSISSITASTDSLGRSQARWTLGTKTGTQNASVSASGTAALNLVAVAQAGAPTQVNVETGDRQSQIVRQTLPLPLVARIIDQYGNGVSGVTATWSAVTGGGTLLATSAASDATGRAAAIWTLGATAGSQLTTLAVTGMPLTVFTATGIAATGDSVVIEAGNNQTGTVGTALATPLIVRIRDSSGNPVVGTTVIFAITSGGGTLTPSIATTDANGRAQAAWTLGSFAGAQTATATAGSKTLTFVATGASAGGGGGGGGALTPSQLVLVSGNGQTGNVGQTLASPIVVRVIDANGVPVSGTNVTWTLAAGNSGGLVSPSVSRTDGSGDATLLWTLGSKVGLQQVTASVTGIPSVTLQATAQIGSAGALLIDNGDAQVGGTGALLATYLRVLVVDQSGTPVVGARVIWSAATGNGTLSKASGLTNAAGLDSAAWTLGTTVGTQQVTATVTGLAVVTFRGTASTSAGPASTPASIVKISGDGQSAISGKTLPVPIVVEVRDASGTPLASVPVAFATASGGYLAPANVTTGVDGRASTLWTLSSNTGTTVTTDVASVTVGTLAPVTFSATVRPAYRVRWMAGGDSATSPLQRDTTGATLRDTLEVQVYDPTGGLFLGVAGQTVGWSTLAGAEMDGLPVNSVVVTDNNGRAKNRWVLRTPGGLGIPPQNIAKRMKARAAMPDGTPIGEVEFQARVHPGSLCSVSQNSSPTKPAVGTSVADTATVKDCNGFVVPNAAVTFTVQAPGSGSVSPSSTTTNSNGQAITTWTVDTLTTPLGPALRTLSALASGKAVPYAAAGDPTYSATGLRVETLVAGAPATPLTVTGVPAVVTVSTSYTVTVTVKDRYNNVVPTQTVNFVASGGGVAPATPGSVSSASGTTGIDGTVSVVWTTGSAAVSNTLTITAGGVVASITR